MRLSHVLRGLEFGKLYKIHGIVTYKLSPFEQKAFAGAVSHGLPNMFRRFRENVFIVTPPFILAYMVYNTAEALHDQSLRKNPADYENDV